MTLISLVRTALQLEWVSAAQKMNRETGDIFLTDLSDCLPVVPESYQSYPASYVTALEDHAAVLERTLNEQQAGTTTEQFEFVGSQPLGIPQTQRSFFGFSETSTSDLVDAEFDTLLGEEGDVSWQNPQTPNLFTGSLDLAYQSDGIDHNYAQPSKDMPAMSSMPSSYLSQTEVKHPASIDPIPVSTAASFFRTYFQCIHPQYPFLSIKDCNLWYDQWKSAPADNPITGWPALFVKMVGFWAHQCAKLTLKDFRTRVSCPSQVGHFTQVPAPRFEVTGSK